MKLRNIFKKAKSPSIVEYKYEKYDQVVALINRYKDDCYTLFCQFTTKNIIKRHMINITLTHFTNLFREYIDNLDDKEQIDGAYRLTLVNIETYVNSIWSDLADF